MFSGPESVPICPRAKLNPCCDPNASLTRSADTFHAGGEGQTANCSQVDPVISRALYITMGCRRGVKSRCLRVKAAFSSERCGNMKAG